MPSAQATLDAIGDAIISTDVGGRITYVNPAAAALTGWSQASATDRLIDDVLQLIDPQTQARLPSPLTLAIERNTAVELPAHSVLIGRGGHEAEVEDSATPIRDAAGTVIGAVIVFRSIGTTLAHAQRMAYIAMHDPLTGLPNRRLLLDRLDVALAGALRRRHSVAVGFLDVNGFKTINDRHGHAVGDRLLQAIGIRLQSAVRVSDTVCRYGGDEFVVVLDDVGEERHLRRLASTLLQAAHGLYQLDGQDVEASLSLGLALAPRDGRDASSLIARADAAMYASRALRPAAPDVPNGTDVGAAAQ